MTRVRRSALFVPGINGRALEKAKGLSADCVIFDLEDSVAAEKKDEALRNIRDAMSSRSYDDRELVVRMNGLHGKGWMQECAAICEMGPDAVLVPKVNGAGDILEIERSLTLLKAKPDIKLWVMIENASALARINEIAECSGVEGARLSAFMIGPNDIALDTRIRMRKGRAEMVPLLLNCVVAARSCGLSILDGPYGNIEDREGFAAECEQARNLGFDGKALIHPGQIEIANRAFMPTEEELSWAEQIVSAFERPENMAVGVIRVNGQMIERLHLEMAKRMVALSGLKIA
jgi:citrate lyase subunit beta/citryl-CoA lyase